MVRDQLISEHSRLKSLTQHNLRQLVESEFTLAHTMTDLAETEAGMGNAEHARMLLDKVKQAVAAAQGRLSEAGLSEKQKSDTMRQLDDLEPRLQAVWKQVKDSPSSGVRGGRRSPRKWQ